MNRSRDINVPTIDNISDHQTMMNSNIIDLSMCSDRKKDNKLEYLPLVLLKHSIEKNKNPDPIGGVLRVFNGNPESQIWSQENFIELPRGWILERQKSNNMKLMLWVTMYNEHYKQFLETMAGIFRGYYELWGDDASYESRVSVVVVWDGFEAFDKIEKEEDHPDKPTFEDKLTKVGLYEKRLAKNFRWRELTYQAQLNSQNKIENSSKGDYEKEHKEEIKTEGRSKKDLERKIENLK
jgi:hypothetical protein